MTQYTITIDVSVWSEPDLLQAAVKNYTDQNYGPTVEDDALWLLAPNGVIDVGACLVQLFDPGESPPGVDILDSGAVRHIMDASASAL